MIGNRAQNNFVETTSVTSLLVMLVNATALIILHVITAIANFISFCTACVGMDNYQSWDKSWKIHSGCSPRRPCNEGLLAKLVVLALMLLYLAALILEILLCLTPFVSAVKMFNRLRGGFIRACVYIVGGILLLSVAGDLGIAMGSIGLILGLIWLIFDLLLHFGVIESDLPTDGEKKRQEA